MKHQRLDLVLGSPSFISISILESEDREAAERTFKLIKRDYKPKLIEKGEQSIKIALKDVLCSVELIKEKNWRLNIQRIQNRIVSCSPINCLLIVNHPRSKNEQILGSSR